MKSYRVPTWNEKHFLCIIEIFHSQIEPFANVYLDHEVIIAGVIYMTEISGKTNLSNYNGDVDK